MIVTLAAALLHFLWQGILLGLAFALLRPVLRRVEASTRYVLLLGLLALAPVLAGSTLLLILHASAPSPGAPPPDPSSPHWAYLVTSVWAAGVTTLAGRSALELRRLRVLRATGLPLRAWHGTLDQLRRRLGVVARVLLAESPAVQTPMVTGWFRPMILLPLGLATRLPADWIESILAHELAHVRRHDIVLGVLQRGIEVCLFFHPVIWWISTEIRLAREEACDDLVVDALRSPLDYARALTELADPNTPTPALAMGLKRKGSLMSRIQHIVTRSPRPVRPPTRRLPALGVALTLGIAATVGCLSQLEDDEDEAIARSATPDHEGSDVTIEIDTDEYRVDGRRVDLRDLSEMLERRHEQDPDVGVRLVASRDAEHERVAAVMDAAKASGIVRLGILATPSAAESNHGLSIAWLPERVVDFEPEIVAAAQRHGVDPNLVAIFVLAESGGDPQARSPMGARGLMQVMPTTAARIADQRGLPDHTEDKLDDPAYNLDLGTWFLARQLEEFGTDQPDDEAIALAAAAYNAGPDRLRQSLQGTAELSDETQRYRSIVATLWSERSRAESTILGLRESR